MLDIGILSVLHIEKDTLRLPKRKVWWYSRAGEIITTLSVHVPCFYRRKETNLSVFTHIPCQRFIITAEETWAVRFMLVISGRICSTASTKCLLATGKNGDNGVKTGVKTGVTTGRNGSNFPILAISKTPNDSCKLFLENADLNQVLKIGNECFDSWVF